MDQTSFLKLFGSAAGLARLLGIHETAVRNWFGRGSIPAKYDARIMDAARAVGTPISPEQLFELRQSISKKEEGTAA